jgi:Putative DNA-binding domain
MVKSMQDHMIRALDHGPDALNPALFEGSADRVFRAFQLHATTIHRARLQTLEHSFPDIRAAMGADAFRAACNAYVETAQAKACDLNSLSNGFAGFVQKELKHF